jgi:hypothetical protein
MLLPVVGDVDSSLVGCQLSLARLTSQGSDHDGGTWRACWKGAGDASMCDR